MTPLWRLLVEGDARRDGGRLRPGRSVRPDWSGVGRVQVDRKFPEALERDADQSPTSDRHVALPEGHPRTEEMKTPNRSPAYLLTFLTFNMIITVKSRWIIELSLTPAVLLEIRVNEVSLYVGMF